MKQPTSGRRLPAFRRRLNRDVVSIKMRRLRHIITFLILALISYGEDLTLGDGRTLKEAQILWKRPDSVKIRHESGIGIFRPSDFALDTRQQLFPRPKAPTRQARLQDSLAQAEKRYGKATLKNEQSVGGKPVSIVSFFKRPYLIWLYFIDGTSRASGIKYAKMSPALDSTVDLDPMTIHKLLSLNITEGNWEAVPTQILTNAFGVLGQQAAYESEHYDYWINMQDSFFATYEKEDQGLFITTFEFHELRGKNANVVDDL